MLNSPFSPWPSFTEEEADAVRDLILSNKVNYWTGQECREFEKEFATWAGTEYAIALANGTVALDLALNGLGIGPGDEVIVTPRTFLASVSSIVNAGAIPVFAEVDRDSQNITAQTIQAVLTPRTRGVICVHLAGWPCDMDPIMELAALHDLKVIEDCAQAHGATYNGRPVGSIGHIGAWSFCQDKIMTTGGEGGMVTTNDRSLWLKMWSYKDHGKSWEAIYEREHQSGFRWLHESFGTNWRMIEVQGVIGRIQLRRMAEWRASRINYAERIWSVSRELKGLRAPVVPENCVHAAYKCYVFVEPEQLKADWNRDRILSAISELGVPCFSGSCSEVYLEKAFDDTGWRPEERLAVAKELGETSLMFMVHPTLTEAEIDKTCDVICSVMQQASKP
ncbi:DegT/DnrJ/EryC1/StrS family aminotransferase [Pseudomonas iridis]|uniref:DegT/DnrJ/EryC1/StrS family aminotransferase n=1 Tax=Pseudomonas iridis TaxID=2710587 RepID=UPI001B332307|nr:DegT/DnrJ/EryC1/StrS aminotransferase family protein [Pseudomonas iridis]